MFRFCLCIAVLVLVSCSQSPAPLSTYGAGVGAGSAGIHTVSSGDTLYGISRRYKIDAPEIAYLNKLSEPYHLKDGQRLRLPPPEKYEVRSGDSLSSVARLFNVSQSRLADINSLSKPYRILAGEILSIPSIRGLEGEIVSAIVTPVAKQALPAHKTERILPTKVEPETVVTASSASKRVSVPISKPSRFLKPVSGKVISGFGPKKNGLYNDGINISTERGTPVKASATGEVVYAGSGLKGYGNLVLMKHGGRYLTAYGHLGEITVKKGAVIKAGQKIGTVGTSGQVKIPQLHFEIRKGTKALDPNKFI